MGLGASLETWLAQREAFAARHRVILFDNRGAGESEHPPPPWTVPDMAADAIGVLDALGIARAHVLGVSDGRDDRAGDGDPLARARRSIGGRGVASRVPIRCRRAFLLFRRWARLQGPTWCRKGVANLPWLVSPSVLNDPERLEEFLGVVGTMPLMAPEALLASGRRDPRARHLGASRSGARADARPGGGRGRADAGLSQSGDRGCDSGRAARRCCRAAITPCSSSTPSRSTPRCWSFSPARRRKNPDGHRGDAPPRR